MRNSVPGPWLAIASCIAAGFALAQDRDLRVCRHARADRGASIALDHGELAREYARVGREFARRVDATIEDLPKLMDRPVDCGLPACRSSGRRSQALPDTLPRELRSRKFLFAAEGDVGRLRARYPDATVLVTRARSIGALEALANDSMSATVIATLELSDAFGIHCAPAVVTVSPEGDRLDITYGE